MRAASTRWILVSVCCLGLTACADPVTGDWESDYKVKGKRDTFTLDESGGRIVGQGSFNFGENRCSADISGSLRHQGNYVFTLKWVGACRSLEEVEVECDLLLDDTSLECGKEITFHRLDN